MPLSLKSPGKVIRFVSEGSRDWNYSCAVVGYFNGRANVRGAVGGVLTVKGLGRYCAPFNVLLL